MDSRRRATLRCGKCREHVLARIEQVPARRRHAAERRGGLPAVEPLQPPRGGVREHAGEDLLGLAEADGVGMLGDLLGVEGRMRAAHQDGDVPVPEPPRDLVAPQRGDGPDADRDGVHVGGVVHLLRRVVEEGHLPLPRGQGPEIRQDGADELAPPELVRGRTSAATRSRTSSMAGTVVTEKSRTKCRTPAAT